MTDILLIGEAWGEVEERERTAFVGPTGHLLNQMLAVAGLRRADCPTTNVFNLRPPGNKIEALCGDSDTKIEGYPALSKGGYIRQEFAKELARLGDEILRYNPNLIVALGNTAAWAMLGKTTMKSLRGTVHLSTHTVKGYKVLPTYHPAAIFRQYSLKPTVILDLGKAKRESASPLIHRPERFIWIEPSLEDLYEFDRLYIQPCERLSVDIETYRDCITCIGFAPREDVAIVIPFPGFQRARADYWPSLDTQHRVYYFIKEVLSRPVPKIFQNGLYDISFLLRTWGIGVAGVGDDTMLLHHALQPESLKSLGYLGSIYTSEGNWKSMREKVKTIKRED
jgi:uracil-DNA glycosylase